MTKIISFSFFLVLLFSCAEVLPPSGGEKDVNPPKLKKSNPLNETIFFDQKTIELQFDEFITFKSSSENIFISPSLEKKPIFRHLGKKLFITFQEDLKLNTTYTISLDNAIQDYNESNILENFNYVFSTGAYIDSLEIKGNILDVFTNIPVEKVYVFLYEENEDSVLYKKPLYLAKTDKSGNYTFKNLKAGNYKIAALEDKNLNLIYDQNSERIAFNTSVIYLDENKFFETLYLFENNEKVEIKDNKQIIPNHYQIKLNKAFSTLKLDINNYSSNDIIDYSLDKTIINYWHNTKDTISEFLFLLDNVYTDTISTTLSSDETTAFNIDITSNKFIDKNHLEISFPLPIINFNENLLTIYDKENNNILYKYSWIKDKLKLDIETYTNIDTLYLAIKDSCFTSFNNKFNTKIEKEITSFNSKYSQLVLKLPLKEENLILQLINVDNEIIEEKNVSRETSLTFNKIAEGKYTIRIFEDKNNNSNWDSGLFHVKQQPEKTILYTKDVEIKSNFDKELELKF